MGFWFDFAVGFSSVVDLNCMVFVNLARVKLRTYVSSMTYAPSPEASLAFRVDFGSLCFYYIFLTSLPSRSIDVNCSPTIFLGLFKMVQTRARDHGASDQTWISSKPAEKSKAKSLPSTKANSDPPNQQQQRQSKKRGHTDDEPGKADGTASPAPKKAKPSHIVPTTKAKSIAHANENANTSAITSKLSKMIDKHGTLPLSDLGLSDPTSPTPSTLLALVFHAMLTSARISHELAYKSVACLIEAGYHDVETLSKSTWEERTKILTRGGYTRYREKTATALGELAEGVRGEYGMFLLFPFVCIWRWGWGCCYRRGGRVLTDGPWVSSRWRSQQHC